MWKKVNPHYELKFGVEKLIINRTSDKLLEIPMKLA